MANGTSVLFVSGLFSADEAMGYVRLLADLATKAPTVCLSVSQFVRLSVCMFIFLLFHKVSGLYLSLAVSLCGLAGAGHHGAASLADAIAAKWVQEADRGEPARVGS